MLQASIADFARDFGADNKVRRTNNAAESIAGSEQSIPSTSNKRAKSARKNARPKSRAQSAKTVSIYKEILQSTEEYVGLFRVSRPLQTDQSTVEGAKHMEAMFRELLFEVDKAKSTLGRIFKETRSSVLRPVLEQMQDKLAFVKRLQEEEYDRVQRAFNARLQDVAARLEWEALVEQKAAIENLEKEHRDLMECKKKDLARMKHETYKKNDEISKLRGQVAKFQVLLKKNGIADTEAYHTVDDERIRTEDLVEYYQNAISIREERIRELKAQVYVMEQLVEVIDKPDAVHLITAMVSEHEKGRFPKTDFFDGGGGFRSSLLGNRSGRKDNKPRPSRVQTPMDSSRESSARRLGGGDGRVHFGRPDTIEDNETEDDQDSNSSSRGLTFSAYLRSRSKHTVDGASEGDIDSDKSPFQDPEFAFLRDAEDRYQQKMVLMEKAHESRVTALRERIAQEEQQFSEMFERKWQRHVSELNNERKGLGLILLKGDNTTEMSLGPSQDTKAATTESPAKYFSELFSKRDRLQPKHVGVQCDLDGDMLGSSNVN
ncbi:hypothetical protein HK102_012107 [Quaeritorhiza haematococci]|nr:hypothetical protein HK102_012107 [Quaeritorhiza haematococci]